MLKCLLQVFRALHRKQIASKPLATSVSGFRDWSLITGRGGGGGTKREVGGQVKFYPYKKGGGGISFSHPEGGPQKNFEVVLIQEF